MRYAVSSVTHLATRHKKATVACAGGCGVCVKCFGFTADVTGMAAVHIRLLQPRRTRTQRTEKSPLTCHAMPWSGAGPMTTFLSISSIFSPGGSCTKFFEKNPDGRRKRGRESTGCMAQTKKKRLSFCITCKNRASQLKKTLRQNLDDNLPDREDIEFVLVDFDTKGVRQFVQDNFQDELADGYLRYFHTKALPFWSAPVAKNTSHWLGRGDVLVNLDVDNYTLRRGGRFVLSVFDKYGSDILFHQRDPDHRPTSTYGRIALSRAAFTELNGYNEALMPVGYQDTDLIRRFVLKWPERLLVQYADRALRNAAASLNAKRGANAPDLVEARRQKSSVFLLFPAAGCPTFVPQNDQEKLANVDRKFLDIKRERGWSDSQLKRWMNDENRRISESALHAKRFVSNVNAHQTHTGVHPLSLTEPLSPTRFFYLNLTSGLCNRLRTLLAYAFVARRVSGHVYFVWTPSDECPGTFEQHFAPMAHCTPIAAKDWERELHDAGAASTKKHGAAKFKLKRGQELVSADHTKVIFHGQRSFADMVRQYSFVEGGAVRAEFVQSTLCLNAVMQKKVREFAAAHHLRDCVGVHMRRTDHVQYAEHVGKGMSDAQFLAAMQQRLDGQGPAASSASSASNASSAPRRLFLATDNPSTQTMVEKAFPGKVVLYKRVPNKPQGSRLRFTSLEHSIMELFLLAQCGAGELIGTPYSSFSGMAKLLAPTAPHHPCRHERSEADECAGDRDDSSASSSSRSSTSTRRRSSARSAKSSQSDDDASRLADWIHSNRTDESRADDSDSNESEQTRSHGKMGNRQADKTISRKNAKPIAVKRDPSASVRSRSHRSSASEHKHSHADKQLADKKLHPEASQSHHRTKESQSVAARHDYEASNKSRRAKQESTKSRKAKSDKSTRTRPDHETPRVTRVHAAAPARSEKSYARSQTVTKTRIQPPSEPGQPTKRIVTQTTTYFYPSQEDE